MFFAKILTHFPHGNPVWQTCKMPILFQAGVNVYEFSLDMCWIVKPGLHLNKPHFKEDVGFTWIINSLALFIHLANNNVFPMHSSQYHRVFPCFTAFHKGNNMLTYHLLPKFWRYNKVILTTSAFCQTLAHFIGRIKQIKEKRRSRSPWIKHS